MSGKSIFTAHQEFVGTWGDVVTTHEANLKLVLEKRPGGTAQQTADGTVKTVAVQTVSRTSEDALQIFSPISLGMKLANGETEVDKKLEYKRRALASLTYVIDEIAVIKRRIEDGDPSLIEDPKAVVRRSADLLGNLVRQCFGLLTTRLIYDGKLDRVRLIWTGMADLISALALLSKSKDHRLCYEALELLSMELQQSSQVTQADKLALSEVAVKVLKSWCEKALTAWDVFNAASLYLVINRIGYKPSHGLFTKVYGLVKISPNLPVMYGRKCMKLEDYLFNNTSHVPSYASNLSRDLSNQRKAFANYVASNVEDFSKRLAHDIVFKNTLQTAEKVRHLIFSILFAHSMERLALPKATLNPLLILAESLGACEEILAESPSVVPPEIVIAAATGAPGQPTAAMLKSDVDYEFAMAVLSGSRTLSPTRCIALSLSLACSTKNPSLSEVQLQSEWEAMRNLRRYCDATSLFTPFPELFEPMVKMVVEGDLVQLSRRLKYLVRAFRPCSTSSSIVVESGTGALEQDSFVPHMMRKALKEWVVDYLFEEIDQTVRSRVVMKLAVDTDLSTFARKVARIRSALDCEVLDLGFEGQAGFCIRDQVEEKIVNTWHEMRCTGIDRTWETYAEMAILAKEYFDLDVYRDPLVPTVTSVTGCDVLEIAMDMQAFATKYNYNMNQEFFIERRPHGKYVSLVTVDSIARSIRTLGSGILSTIVNVVYQFLAVKFEQFSQCLFDDHVKSFLKRERRWMAKEHSSSGGAFYPFDRAIDFSQHVKQSHVFLQRTRMIVTEIGNALGFVRSVRAGGMKWAGNVHCFLPSSTIQTVRDLRLYHHPRTGGNDNLSLADVIFTSGVSEDGASTISGMVADVEDSVRTLHKHIHDVSLRQFPDYLLILVDVFRKVESAKNEHLKNAFMIIPAMCVDYVDASLHAKDQVARAHKNPHREAYFTDDGFVMGVAAVLAMLSQDSLFDTLKFFKGVAVYFEGGGGGAAGTSVSPPPKHPDDSSGLHDDEEDGSGGHAGASAGLSKRRHRGAAREYELLMYALSGARVFYKRVAEEYVATTPVTTTTAISSTPKAAQVQQQ